MCALPCPFAEHWNYFGMDEVLGPVAISIRREKLEDHKEHGQQYNYRIIFRTSEVSSPSASFFFFCILYLKFISKRATSINTVL